MEYIVYERPRERLKARGAASLTLPELLQLIIGSGSPKASVAKLARQVAILFEKGVPTYDQLFDVQGLGNAKVCQLLAAYEIGHRLNTTTDNGATISQNIQVVLPAINELSTLSRQSIAYVTFNGSGEVIRSHRRALRSGEHYSLAARRVLATALSDGAASLAIGIGWKNQSLQPTLADLNITKSLHDTADLLQISVNEIVLVSKQGVSQMRREA